MSGVLDDLGHRSRAVRLGTDIVRQFAHWSDEDAAATEVATHIKKFWDPRIRHELIAHVRLGDTDLPPLLVRAAEHFLDGEIDRAEVREPSGG